MFSSKCNQFPVVEDGKIEVIPFLEASKEIVKFVDILGSVFKPVKNDINGNIEKLHKAHLTDKDKFLTLNDLIEHELAENSRGEISIDALLWLKRALEYINVFLTCFVDDYRQKLYTENLSPFFHRAYEEKLKPYHGWLVQKVFGLIVMAAPSRKSLLLVLSGNKEDEQVMEDVIFNDIELFLKSLGSNIDAINALYESHELQFDHKV